VKKIEVLIYSRSGCHLCDVAEAKLNELRATLDFKIEKQLIDGDLALEREYGEKVPVILINGTPHDYWRVNPERFTKAILEIKASQ
jgi:glutaredoxin